MRLLADTHVYLWWLADDPKLGTEARAAMAEQTAIIYISAASIWEISIKSTLGKLDVEKLFQKAIPEQVRMGWRDDALDNKRKGELPMASLAYVDQLYRIDGRIDRALDTLERAAGELRDSNWAILHPSDVARLSAFRTLVAEAEGDAERTSAERPEVRVTAPREYLLGRIFFGVVAKTETGLRRVRKRHGDEGAPEYLKTVIQSFLGSLTVCWE